MVSCRGQKQLFFAWYFNLEIPFPLLEGLRDWGKLVVSPFFTVLLHLLKTEENYVNPQRGKTIGVKY
jgi:hypothetical protein